MRAGLRVSNAQHRPPARSNLLLRSQEFNNGAWLRFGTVGLSTDAEAAPDGTITADTITLTSGVMSGIYQVASVTPLRPYTFSIYTKLGTLPDSDFRMAFYDETAATFLAVDIVPAPLPVAGGWTRVIYTITPPAGCVMMRSYPLRFSPVTGGTVGLWGAQLELGDTATSYMPTAGISG